MQSRLWSHTFVWDVTSRTCVHAFGYKVAVVQHFKKKKNKFNAPQTGRLYPRSACSDMLCKYMYRSEKDVKTCPASNYAEHRYKCNAEVYITEQMRARVHKHTLCLSHTHTVTPTPPHPPPHPPPPTPPTHCRAERKRGGERGGERWKGGARSHNKRKETVWFDNIQPLSF